MKNYPVLWNTGATLQQHYLAQNPFPHVVFEDFLRHEHLRALVDGFPPPDDRVWKTKDSDKTRNKHDIRYSQVRTKDSFFQPAARSVIWEFNSGDFCAFLSHLTGVPYLQPDPYFIEGGFHMVGDKGFLMPHADFSHHPSGLERRVNLLLYLNDDWKEEWGGALNLYDTDGKVAHTISPVLNRCLIFNTSDTSFHGHPEPMNLPEGVWRRSLALYYYSAPRPERERKKIVWL